MNLSCDKCKVSKFCSKFGSSPLKSKNVALCELVGNYGRKPVDESILSTKSKELVTKNGPCLTLVYVPYEDELGNLRFSLEKIFHPAIKHEREVISSFTMQQLYPKTYEIK